MASNDALSIWHLFISQLLHIVHEKLNELPPPSPHVSHLSGRLVDLSAYDDGPYTTTTTTTMIKSNHGIVIWRPFSCNCFSTLLIQIINKIKNLEIIE